MPKITINGHDVEVEQGTNLLEAAKTIGVEVPHYCYHPALKVVASCRMCFVEVTQEVRGRTATKLMTACNTAAADGMVVETETDAVKKARNDILEFLLINHPLDCPVCDQAGECKLQDYAFIHGTSSSRFSEPKRFKAAKKLGSGIRHFTNRCILCDRCVRFLRDYVGTAELSIVNMGNNNEINIFPGSPIDNRMATNVVDLCPVGALLSEDFLFKARVWNLKPMPSMCPGCSRGCSTYLDVHNNIIQRTRPRENHDVNTYFICDPGRFTYHAVESDDRIEGPLLRDGDALLPTRWQTALDAVAGKLADAGSDAVLLVSTHLPLEEMEAVRLLAAAVGTENVGYIPNAHVEDEERFPGGFVIDGDKSPNTAGAKKLFEKTIDDMALSEATPAVIVFNSSWDTENIAEEHLNKIRLAAFVGAVDVLNGPLAEQADAVLAGRLWAEKTGFFVNSQGMEQRFKPAILGPVQSRNERDIVRDLKKRVLAGAAQEMEAST